MPAQDNLNERGGLDCASVAAATNGITLNAMTPRGSWAHLEVRLGWFDLQAPTKS
jgi:hypothetical protein